LEAGVNLKAMISHRLFYGTHLTDFCILIHIAHTARSSPGLFIKMNVSHEITGLCLH